MLKRILAIVTIAVIMLSMSVSLVVADTITAQNTADRNVLFSNGYVGFCLNVKKSGAYSGDTFNVADDGTLGAVNIAGGGDVSQRIKVLFAHCFEDIFVSDDNGGYYISDGNLVQAVIWHYTNDQYIWGAQKEISNKIEALIADGVVVPDEGYSVVISNGDKIDFSFVIMETNKDGQQDFFAYKLNVTPAGSVVEPSEPESSEESSAESSEESSAESSEESSAESSEESSAESSEESSAESSEESSVESSEDSSAESSEESSVESSEESSAESSEDSSAESSEESSAESSEESSAESSEESSAESSEDSSAESSEDSSEPEHGGDFVMDVDAPDTYVAGEEVIVSVTVNDVNLTPGLTHVNGNLYFDSDILGFDFDIEAGVELKGSFAGYNEWEGFSTLDVDQDGNWYIEVDASTSGAEENGDFVISTVSQDGLLVFNFTFVAKHDATGDTVVFIPDDTVNGDYNHPETQLTVEYIGFGSSDKIIDDTPVYNPPETSEDSSAESSDESTEDSSAESSEESTEDSSAESSDESTEDSSAESSEESTEDSSAESSEESTEDSSAESSEGSTEDSSAESSEESTEDNSDESIDEDFVSDNESLDDNSRFPDESSKPSTPPMGDGFEMWLWCVILAVAACGGVAAVKIR